MSNCNSILSIHTGMGTTQNDRVKPALQPGYFRLDERSEQDFILFVQKLSAYVKFYNEFDLHDGNWSGFFEKESTSILILIANWNIELLQSSYKNKEHEILINEEPASQKAILLDYFNEIISHYTTLTEKANYLDDPIIEKQNLLSSSYVIFEKLKYIIDQATGSTDIPALIKNYAFSKTMQQLFGLLASWKNFSQNAIEYQLNNYAGHTPHYTLFLAFLKLLNVAKEKFNEFTKNHLDFYYKDVLRVKNENARPDYVHLIAEPFPGTKPFMIPKGAIFLGGKNTAGQNKFYAATQDRTINAIKLNSFLSMHFTASKYYKADLLDLNAKNKGFNAFIAGKTEYKEAMMIASPLLFMQSGERIIYLQFNNKHYEADDFTFFITGKEQIIEITNKDTTASHLIKLVIPASEKSIVPFDKKVHSGFEVSTAFPVLKIVPKNTAVINNISRIELTVKVNNFKSFKLDSSVGSIDIEKPFYPFGEFPKSGNSVFISSNEFFMKNNAEASFSFPAILTPSIKIKRTEERLKDVPNPTKWIKDKVNVMQLDNGVWQDYSDYLKPVVNNYPVKEYLFDDSNDPAAANGKIKVELDYYKYNGESFMLNYIKASENKTKLPYKPRFKEFIFNYTASQVIDLNTRKYEANPIEIYKSIPFGFEKFSKGIFRFSKHKNSEGEIYIGFENAIPNDGLSFLIQLEEGTANPQLEPAVVSWQYLSNNIWTNIESNAIGDETLSLTQSGLVAITVPQFNAQNNTKMPAGLLWLKISVSNINAICKFIGIHAQAIKAVLTDFENSGIAFTEHAPKETIGKFHKPINTVKKIIQPYASFGGKITEPDEFLYTRISERLRHKNRAITTWDYERIILQEFPEVYRVKTLSHYRYDAQISNVSAGYVTLIPVAKSSNSENISWKPLLSLNKMLLIKEHLGKIASPHARINVKPPKAEMVQVHFKVKFHSTPGMDNSLYIKQLKETINAYLSPWAYESNEVNFAGDMEFSSIIQLVDNQSYVDYITDFKIEQYILNENNEVTGSPIQNLSRISPQTDFTLFIPNETHLITAI